MRLEAKDVKNPSLVCVATVKSVLADGRLVITFDGWTGTTSWHHRCSRVRGSLLRPRRASCSYFLLFARRIR